jgi:hypothetical protein
MLRSVATQYKELEGNTKVYALNVYAQGSDAWLSRSYLQVIIGILMLWNFLSSFENRAADHTEVLSEICSKMERKTVALVIPRKVVYNLIISYRGIFPNIVIRFKLTITLKPIPYLHTSNVIMIL